MADVGYRQLPITPFEPQQSNPLQMLAGINQLKTAQLQQQGLAQENQQRQIGLQDQQAMTAALHEWDGKDLNALAPLMVKHGASANAVIGLKQKVLEQQKTYSDIAAADATTGSKNLETQKGKNDQILGGINSLKDVPDEQLAQAIPGVIQSLTQQGALAPQEAQQAAGIAQSGDPVAIRKQLDIFAKLHSTASQQMEQAAKQAEAFKNNQEGRKAQFEANNLQNNGPQGPAAEAKYRSILGKLSAGQDVPDADIQFAKGMELSNTKTTTQSDTLGVTSNNTSRPGGLAAAMRARQGGGGGNAPAGNGAAQPGAPSAKQSLVDMIGQYKLNPTMLQRMAVKHPDVLAAVSQKYPDWNQSDYNAKNKILLSYTSGPESRSINAINTALGHLGELDQAAQALSQNNIPLLHSLASKLGAATGDTAATTYQAILHRVSPELTSAYVQGGGGEGERGANQADFDVSKGAAQIRSNVAESAKLLRSKISAQENQWNTTYKPTRPEDQFQNRFITPAAKQTLDRLSSGGSSAAAGMTRIKASDGSLHDIPSANLSKAKQIDPNLQVVQ